MHPKGKTLDISQKKVRTSTNLTFPLVGISVSHFSLPNTNLFVLGSLWAVLRPCFWLCALEGFRRPYAVPGITPRLVVCKSGTLTIVESLRPKKHFEETYVNLYLLSHVVND